MTAAYAAIANNGTYTEPILYTKVLDKDGNVLLDNTKPATHQVIKDSTAALLTSAMQDVITRGTGTAARLYSMPAAGKTGTTENSTDLWLSAYTPYYTCSVWGGYDSNKPMSNMDQAWHEVMWKNIMERVHEGLEYKDFTMPSSVEQKTICTQTGLLATATCPPLTEYFAKGTAPSQSCSGHYVPKEEKEDDEKDKDKNKDDDKKNENPETPDENGGSVTPPDGGGNEGGGNEGGGAETPDAGGGEEPPAE